MNVCNICSTYEDITLYKQKPVQRKGTVASICLKRNVSNSMKNGSKQCFHKKRTGKNYFPDWQTTLNLNIYIQSTTPKEHDLFEDRLTFSFLQSARHPGGTWTWAVLEKQHGKKNTIKVFGPRNNNYPLVEISKSIILKNCMVQWKIVGCPKRIWNHLLKYATLSSAQ
jgi:hypothetical protein